MKLFISGVLIPPDQYSGKSVTVDITDNGDSDRKSKIVSDEFTLTGAAYEVVKTELIDNPNGKNLFLPVKIYEDECCASDVLLFEGIIRGDSVDWCFGECSCTVHFFEHTEDTKRLDCVKTTLIWDNWNDFQSQAHPRMVYCIEMRPSILQAFFLGGYLGLSITLLVLTPIVAIISYLIEAINYTIITPLNFALGAFGVDIPLIYFEGNEETSLLETYLGLMDHLNEVLIGCGRKHPSPLVRDYIKNVCEKCGMTFQSSIFNDPSSDYYNSVYLSAPVEKGTRDENVLWIDQNKPLLTLEKLLDELKIPFSANWDLIGTVLRFEREDFFWSGQTFANYETLVAGDKIENKLCLSWREDDRAAFIELIYTNDAVDWVGNEAAVRFNDIVEWNVPFSELQSGQVTVRLVYGLARFRGDGIDPDVLTWFENVPFAFGQALADHQKVLIMNNGTAFQPKLLIWDGDVNFGRVKTFDISGFDTPPEENYNFPYMFNEHGAVANTAYPSDTPDVGLYPRFFAWKNPKLIPDKGLEFTFSFRYNCEALSAASDADFVQLPMGVGRIKKVAVDLQKKTIRVSGNV